MSETRALAHELVDSLPERQLRNLLEYLRNLTDTDPERADDEPITDEDRRRIQEAERWFEARGGQGIPMEEVLAEYGLTPDDFPFEK